MRKTIFFCDRCGKEIQGPATQIGVRSLDKDSGFEIERKWKTEVCSSCYKEIDEMISWIVRNKDVHFSDGIPKREKPQKAAELTPADVNYKVRKAESETEKAAEPELKKKKGAKLKLDLGKIAALHNAGWSNRKIADEMHCSDVTIANRLEEAKAFLQNQKNDRYGEIDESE